MVEDLCQVCGAEPTAIVRSFESHPFVDGRNYSLICWTCACVPKYWYIDTEGKDIILDSPDPDHLHTAEEMMEDGWERWHAERSIKAIQQKLKSPKISITAENQHIYSHLILPNDELALGSPAS